MNVTGGEEVGAHGSAPAGGATTATIPVGGEELRGLVALGRRGGRVTVDDVLVRLGSPDPTPAFITAITELLAGAGITLDAEEPTLPPDRPSAGGGARPARPAPGRGGRGAEGSGGAGVGDPVQVYLREIGRVALLGAHEEVALATRIEAGHAAAVTLGGGDEAGSGRRCSGAERARLEALANDGEEAKAALTRANLRLVVSIAKRYAGRGMPLLDLVQEGNLGLMRAVEKFDHTRGFKFSTYATWWIRQSITRSIADQSRTIRIPVHVVETVNRVVRVRRDLVQGLEREPTTAELAAAVGLTPARVREIERLALDTLSLDSPVGDDDSAHLSDLIEDDGAEAPSDAVARGLLGDAVREALGGLSERERAVVRLRFGLDGGQARTLDEVGREVGVTRERVRQIETKTLAKLRRPERSQNLRDYLDGD